MLESVICQGANGQYYFYIKKMETDDWFLTTNVNKMLPVKDDFNFNNDIGNNSLLVFYHIKMEKLNE